MKPLICTIVVLVVVTGAPALGGQQAQKPEPPASTQAAAGVPLRVQLVLAKYKGDKKITSLPYTMSAITGQQARVRVGADVPYAATVPSQAKASADGKPAEPVVVSHAYRTVGITITCTASTRSDGQYRLDINLSDDSIAYDEDATSRPRGVPVFRTFSTSNTLVLKDGATGQITAAADPISGEVLRVDVTLTVVK